MVKIEMDVYLNVPAYLETLRTGLENLYIREEVRMSNAAKADLERISVQYVIGSFTPYQLQSWKLGNAMLNIKSYQDYINQIDGLRWEFYGRRFGTGSTNYIPSLVKHLSEEDKFIAQTCIQHWDAFLQTFFSSIRNIETLRLILKAMESIRANNTGYIIPGLNDDPALLYDEQFMLRMDLIRQQIKDQNELTQPLSGSSTDGKLNTMLSPEEWVDIIQELTRNQYSSTEYGDNKNLVFSWLSLAFAGSNIVNLVSASGGPMKWVGSPASLAEFIDKAIDARWIIYEEAHRGFLYEWVNRVFDYDGAEESMRTYLRNAKNSDTVCFRIGRDENGVAIFKVNFIAPKPKHRVK